MINSYERIIKHKPGLLNIAAELDYVSNDCKVTGHSSPDKPLMPDRNDQRS